MVVSSTGNAPVVEDSMNSLPLLPAQQGLAGSLAWGLLANRAPLHRRGHGQGLVGVTQEESHSGQWERCHGQRAMSHGDVMGGPHRKCLSMVIAEGSIPKTCELQRERQMHEVSRL